MLKVPKTGLTKKIRAHISAMEQPFSACVAAREMKIHIQRFYRLMGFMRARGEVAKVGRGWYEHKEIELNRKPSVVKPRLLKAMHVKIRFSVREIAMLADTYPEMAQYLVARLRKAGEIEAIGKQKTPGGRWQTVYRVRDRDAFFLKHIKGSNQ